MALLETDYNLPTTIKLDPPRDSAERNYIPHITARPLAVIGD